MTPSGPQDELLDEDFDIVEEPEKPPEPVRVNKYNFTGHIRYTGAARTVTFDPPPGYYELRE